MGATSSFLPQHAIERNEAADGEEDQADRHQQHHADGAGGAPLVIEFDIAADQHRYHYGAAAPEQFRRDVEAEREHEDQRTSRQHPGQRQRQKYSPEGEHGAGAEAGAGLHQVARDLLHGGVERQHHERQQDVEGRNDGAEAVVDQRQRLVDHAELAQQLVDDAGPLQQREPGIGADQHAGPERQHHQRQDDDAPPFRRDARRIGNGITEQQRQQRHQQADFERQHKTAPVDVLAPDPAVILQRKAVMIDRLPGEPADRQHDQQQDHQQRRRDQRQHQAVFAALMLQGDVGGGTAQGG